MKVSKWNKAALISSLVLVVTSLPAAESFNDAIKNTNLTGQFRLGYISVAPVADKNKSTTDTREANLILAYSVSDKLDIEFIHTVVDNKSAPADAATNFFA